ncbi:hypothetical protein Tco_1251381, partial [Tanacetum coccineum]
DHDEVFDTLMYLRDGIQDENTKLMGLNDAIVEAEEKIVMKKEYVKTMEAASDDGNNDCDGYQLLYTSMSSEFLDKLAEVAGSSRLQDRMNLVFSGARLNKNRRLIAELEALGQWGDALRCLDYLREMVVRDFGTLEVLEQLLAGAHVGMRLKDSYVADMQQME